MSQQGSEIHEDEARTISFETRLDGVKADMQKRLEENSCPKAQLIDFDAVGIYAESKAAVVYKVLHREDRTIFALKVAQKHVAEDQQIKNRRIVMEKKLTDAVRFKFIVRLHFVYQDIQRFYLFFEATPYGSLEHLVKGFRLGHGETKWYAAQMILAIEYLHACDIAHRNIKPANCLIFADDFLRISDFGMAKIVPERTHTFCGTLPYLAPEIAQGVPYGKYVDWWSMGVSTYEMLYKAPPFINVESLEFKGYSPLSTDEDDDFESLAFDFCRRLLTIKYSDRLGCCEGGAKAIMEHPWFEGLSFRDVYRQRYRLQPATRQVKIKPVKKDFLEKLTEQPTDPDPGLKWFDSFCENPAGEGFCSLS